MLADSIESLNIRHHFINICAVHVFQLAIMDITRVSEKNTREKL